MFEVALNIDGRLVVAQDVHCIYNLPMECELSEGIEVHTDPNS